MTSPVDIVNQALRKISYPTPIGQMYEGSRASRIAVEIYAQTRDDLLRTGNFPFARQAVVLTLLKTAPPGGYIMTPWTTAFPPVPWVYEYAYPTACLDVRSLRRAPYAIPDNNPIYNRFIIASDPSANPSKVILSNLANAQAVITAQITSPDVWEPDFAESLIDALALEFQQSLAVDVNVEKMRAAEEQQSVMQGETRRG